MEDESIEEKRLSPLAVIIVAVIVVAVILYVVVGKRQTFKKVVAGTPAIEFELPDLNGNMHKLSDWRGKVVFLNFWATWCDPCAEEMPSMEALYNGLATQPFEIVAVSIDEGDSKVIEEFVEKYGITFTVLRDPKGKYKELYKTTGVPETFIIDQNGIIAEKSWGPRDWTEAQSISTILTLLKDGPQPPESY